jgi:hypothetical protein
MQRPARRGREPELHGAANAFTLRAAPHGTEHINGETGSTIAGAEGPILLGPTGAGIGYEV